MRTCVICFDFKESNISRQPWRYVYELCKSLARKGVDLKVISNGNEEVLENDATKGIRIQYVKKLNSLLGWSKEVLLILREENPDVVIILLGLTSFLRLNFKIDRPTIGILTSPIYGLKDIMGLGLSEIVRHFRYLLIHLAGAIAPRFLIRRNLNSLERIVVLSQANKENLEKCGAISEKIRIIPNGIDEFDLKLPWKKEASRFRKRISPKGAPVVLYFGSPLTLRGPDMLVKAFAKVYETVPSKLIILSRLEHKELVEDEDLLRNIAGKNGIIDSVEIISDFLEREELKNYIAAADVVCLPFKLVISDVPITLLEAMALGRPTISTDVDGIAELLYGRGLIVEPCNPNTLAKSMMAILTDKELARKLGRSARRYMLTYPRWDHIGEGFTKLMDEILESEKMWRRIHSFS